MSCISCFVSLLLTLVIPLKLTHQALQAKTDTKLWSIYWLVYTLFTGIFWLLPFLDQPPFKFIFVVLLVWLYHDTYKGALFVNDLLLAQVGKVPAISTNLNLIAEKIKFLNVFESDKPLEGLSDKKDN